MLFRSETDTEPWMYAISHINVLKKLPILNVNKELYEKQILSSVHIPHSRGRTERFFKSIFACLTDTSAETIGQAISKSIL